MASSTFKSYEDTYNKGQVQIYTCLDKDGQSVVISKKNPNKHKSGGILDQHPTYFLNLEQILLNPHEVTVSISKDPKAVAHRKRGKVVEYSRNNYINDLNMPGHTNKGDKTTVVVLYQKDPKAKPQNMTLTYYTVTNL